MRGAGVHKERAFSLPLGLAPSILSESLAARSLLTQSRRGEGCATARVRVDCDSAKVTVLLLPSAPCDFVFPALSLPLSVIWD